MSLLAQNTADHLLQIKAIKLNAQNPFTWASGLRSPIYCDNRMILSYPDVRKTIKLALSREAKAFENINAIAGVATAGIAWGAYVADELALPFCYVRSKAKEHGLKNMIEGKLPSGSTVLVIEDLISTGGSSIEAVKALQAENYIVAGVLAIFQYGFEECRVNFEKINTKFASLTDYSTLLERALHAKYILPEELDNLSQWNANPKLWSQQFSNHN